MSGLGRNMYDHNISTKLSQVMDEIGVNKGLVMKRRNSELLNETIQTVIDNLNGENVTTYFLGGQSEGTVTKGLQSDCDILNCIHTYNVIQDIEDFTNGKHNFLIVTDDNSTKGYCYLKHVKTNALMTNEDYCFENENIFVLKNTQHYNYLNIKALQGSVVHGPALSSKGKNRMTDMDLVDAYPCLSWPKSASNWLDQKGLGCWPTQEMKINCMRKGFFLVPVGSKISKNPDVEWRISTSLAERCLMFSLNMTQIRCYVILKMIAKSYFTFHSETKISSFMCKTTLFHCIERSEPKMWRNDNLYICVFVCLLQLRFFVLSQICPHFIINENNLMAGQFTGEEKCNILSILNNLINTYGLGLFGIQTDDLGRRLQIKLDMIPEKSSDQFPSRKEIYVYVCSNLNIQHFSNLLQCLKSLSIGKRETLQLYLHSLNMLSEEGSSLEKKACKLILPEIYTTLGSVLASSDIGQSIPFSHDALNCLELCQDSSLSTKIKLASLYYCCGQFTKSGAILRNIESVQGVDTSCENVVHIAHARMNPICGCYPHPLSMPEEFLEFYSKDITEIQTFIAYCVRFHKNEFNCIPHELKYEMFRSSRDDLQHRDERDDMWMDLSVVDSLPFLYFLQFKVYRHMKRTVEKCLALAKLIDTCERISTLCHKETALNLLGQCYEDQLEPLKALQCYLSSLQVRKRNNAAVWHICKLVAKLLQKKKKVEF